MNNAKKEKIYLSGKMTGLEYREISFRFSKAERLVKGKGYKTVNPMNIWVNKYTILYRLLELLLGKERFYDLVLLYDLWLLSRCQGIFMIGKDWQTSRGAQTEKAFAQYKSLSVETEKQTKS